MVEQGVHNFIITSNFMGFTAASRQRHVDFSRFIMF